MKFILLFFCSTFYGQLLHRQTLSTQGGIAKTQEGITVLQTVGQQSVIGNYSISALRVGQGFQQSAFAVKKTYLRMIKQLFPFFIFFTIMQQVTSQNTSSKQLVRSTTGASGSSESITVNNKSYVIQQSIGQSSAIGTFNNAGFTLRQGFIQPNVLAKIVDVNMSIDLEATFYPNPFVSIVNFQFTKPIASEISISVYDLLGRLVFYQKNNAANSILTIDLSTLQDAMYLVRLLGNNLNYSAKILKKS
jgi:hypothetical protein